MEWGLHCVALKDQGIQQLTAQDLNVEVNSQRNTKREITLYD